jgi:hypothetical protein
MHHSCNITWTNIAPSTDVRNLQALAGPQVGTLVLKSDGIVNMQALTGPQVGVPKLGASNREWLIHDLHLPPCGSGWPSLVVTVVCRDTAVQRYLTHGVGCCFAAPLLFPMPDSYIVV